MNLELESMAIQMPVVEQHPNREAFRGVLTLLDVPSDKPPSGSRGHRVVLTRAAAEAALPSLLGMGLDYAPSLDRHDTRRKIGVITRAEIVGKTLELGGHLFARDFPEIVKEIRKSKTDGASPVSTRARTFYAAEATSEVLCIHFCRATSALWRWVASSITV